MGMAIIRVTSTTTSATIGVASSLPQMQVSAAAGVLLVSAPCCCPRAEIIAYGSRASHRLLRIRHTGLRTLGLVERHHNGVVLHDS